MRIGRGIRALDGQIKHVGMEIPEGYSTWASPLIESSLAERDIRDKLVCHYVSFINFLAVCGCQLVCEALASLSASRPQVLTPHLAPVLKLIQNYTLEAPLNAHKTKLMV